MTSGHPGNYTTLTDVTFDKTSWAQPLELFDEFAPAPIAHAAE